MTSVGVDDYIVYGIGTCRQPGEKPRLFVSLLRYNAPGMALLLTRREPWAKTLPGKRQDRKTSKQRKVLAIMDDTALANLESATKAMQAGETLTGEQQAAVDEYESLYRGKSGHIQAGRVTL